MESADFNNMRRAMVDSQLRTSGVSAPWVIAAMGMVPREDYVPHALRTTAYMDRALSLGEGRALNPPVATASMLEAAEVSQQDNILLLATRNGYVAALLAGQARRLVTIDSLSDLPEAVSKGPFSIIIIDGAIEELPDALLAIATEGGRIVTGIVERGVTRLAVGSVRGGKVVLRPFADTEIAAFPGFARTKEFVF